MKTRRTLGVLLLTFVMCFQFAGVVYAADIEKEGEGQRDLTYVLGNDLATNTRKLATILCNANGIVYEGSGSGTKYLNYAFRNGWITSSQRLWSYENINQGMILESILNSLDYHVDSTTEAITTATELGVYQEGTDQYTLLDERDTYELVQELYALGNYETDCDSDGLIAIIDNIGIGTTEYDAELAKVPDEIMQAFSKCGWQIIMDQEYIDNYNAEQNKNSVGICYYNKKTIYVCKANAVLHEIGHFYQWLLLNPDDFEALYEKEGKQSVSVLREYSTTSSHEYFADYFRFWFRYQDNEEERAKVKSVTPETYAYFEALEAADWLP